jgi:ribosomal protein S18 acetylase RimI-like enzyme
MPTAFHPLDTQRWPDLRALFNAKGCSFARGCWCMFYRESGKPNVPEGSKLAEHRRAQLKALARRTPAPGIIGYRDGVPVGWVSVAPRQEYLKLARSPVMKPVDDKPVWSIVCFVVPSEHRHQGVASALLRGAIEHAKRHGATLLEAYPIDKAKRGSDNWLWHGAQSMYDKAGFVEAARRKPERPIVRLQLDARRKRGEEV